jgi:hypothetical protein
MKRTRSTSKSKPSNKSEIAKQPGGEERSQESMSETTPSSSDSTPQTSTGQANSMQNAAPDPMPVGVDDREGREQNHVRAGGRIASASTAQRDSPSGATEEGQDPDPEAARRRIAERAYSLYVQGGREEGKALEHWLEAERELSHAAKSSDHQWDH